MRRLPALFVVLVIASVGALGQAPQAPGFNNQERDTLGQAVHPGGDFVGQRVVATNYAAVPLTISSVDVRNLEDLPGSQVARIEVRRRADGALLGEETSTNALNGFGTPDGVRIFTTRNNVIARGAAVEFEIRIVLKLGATQGARIRLSTRWSYQLEGQAPAATGFIAATENQVFTVAFVSFANDPDVPGQAVYPGQRFLAQRVVVTNTSNQTITLDRLLIRNFAGAQPLGGAFLSLIEVRRAGDNSLLGQQSNAAQLANFATDVGVLVTPTANHRVLPYAQVKLEIWLTLRSTAPVGHMVQLGTRASYTPQGLPQETSAWIRGGEAQVFTVGAPQGLEVIENDPLTPQNVYAGQRFLAQRVQLGDLDPDPYDVTLKWFLVRNVALEGTRLADERIARIEVCRASDGAILGQTSNPAGLSSGGVQIGATANRTIPDDTSVMIEVWVTLKTPLPDGRQLKLDTTVWHDEGDSVFSRTFDRTAYGNAVFTTGPERTGGLEKAEAVRIRERAVYVGEQLLMQQLRLEDNDPDPYDVTVNSLVIRNAAPTSPLAEQHVARIEVRRASDNALLGQTTDLRGFGQDGVRVLTGSNNVVRDDTSVDLLILVTVKADAVTGRKIKLETVVWHTEGATTYQTVPRVGPGEFTTKANEPPVARFTYTPTRDVRWDTTFTFDPRASTDPDGDISLAKFEWDVGDGSPVVTRTGPQTVSYRFGKGGRFTVKLTVTDEGGLKSTTTATVDVPDNRPPVGVDFGFAPTGPKWSDEVIFTPARGVEDPDGDIARAKFDWDFGDGSPVVSVTGPLAVRRVFGKGGDFTVKLTVTDEGGAAVSATKTVKVTNRAPTGVDFTWDPPRPKWSDEITFTPARGIEDPDGDISLAKFEWDFGDGKKDATTGTAAVTHRFGKGGRFTVKLTVTDQGGAKTEKVWELDVANLAPTGVAFSFAPEAPMWNDEITFTPAEEIRDPDGDIARATFRWEFGDGSAPVTTIGSAPVRHRYGKGGSFTVKLTVVDEGGASNSKEGTVGVTWLTVDFTWEPSTPKQGQPTKFKATVTFPAGETAQTLSYAWDFGDEQRQEGPDLAEITHTYTLAGRFTVTLTVTHPKGSGTRSHELTVGETVPPTVTGLTYSPVAPESGTEVTFSATAVAPADDPVTSWEWDFGDGSAKSTTTTATVKHTYTASNVFTVTVRARNAQGGWSQPRTLSLYVRPKGGALVGTKLLDNPARTQARIQVFLPQGATGVKIQIFDMLGRPVLSADVVGGQYTWNLTDQAGRRIADGLYVYLITATVAGKTERSEVGKILVVR